jgi:ABC-type Na+ efflux pump permease subunit
MIDARASLEGELRERSGALESARDALESARERAAEALAAERARAAAAIEQEQARRADEVAAERRVRTDELAAERRARAQELTAERARAAERLRTAKSRHPPAEILADEDDDGADVDPAAAPEGTHVREDSRDPDGAYDVRVRAIGPQRIDRPVNPALRSRPNWLGRILALMVIIAVIVAVYLVLHSTILHH